MSEVGLVSLPVPASQRPRRRRGGEKGGEGSELVLGMGQSF